MKKFLKQTFAIIMTVAMILTIAPSCVMIDKPKKTSSVDTPKDLSATTSMIDTLVVENQSIESTKLSGFCGENLTWIFNAETGLLDIKGTGDMSIFEFQDFVPWHHLRSRIKTVNISDLVTSIGDYAFSDCVNLTSVTIGNDIAKIGREAFKSSAYYNDASNWENGVLYIGKYLIKAQSTISGAYTIKSGTQAIAKSAFSSCEALTNMIIPDSVVNIDDYTFDNCKSLESATIGNHVESIGEYAFSECSNLKNVTISDSVKYIGYAAFYKCTGLTSITIPDSVTYIKENAFSYCESLTNIKIPDSVKGIDNNTFEYCSALTSVTFSDNLTTIGEYAFSNCTALTNITLPDTVTKIWDGAFAGCTALTNITIPNSVIIIGEYVFGNCKSLSSVTLPNSLNYIGESLFYNCTSLNSIILPDTVEAVCAEAFCRCENLTSITIPVSVTEIGDDAFLGCDKLTDVYYGGNKKEWRQIEFGSNNEDLTNANIDYATKSEEEDVDLSTKTTTLTSLVNTVNGPKLTWNEIYGALDYYVYRRTSGKSWTRIGRTSSTSFTDKTAKSGTTYIYTAKACNDVSMSKYQSGLTVKYLTSPTISKIVNTTTGVDISWDAITGASGYYVYRMKRYSDGTVGSYERIGTTSSISFKDKTARSGVFYYYTVRAYNGSTRSSYRAGRGNVYLTSPKITEIRNASTGVKITWEAVDGAKFGYCVYRKTPNGSYQRVGETDSTSFVDKTAKSGTTYYYTVRAYSGSTSSSYRAGAKLKYLTAPTVSSVTNTTTGAKVVWGKITGASGYNVYRRTANGSYSKIGTTTSTSFTDKTAKSGTTYYYTVRAYNGSTLSSYRAGAKCTIK